MTFCDVLTLKQILILHQALSPKVFNEMITSLPHYALLQIPSSFEFTVTRK